jgi:hypothetical protein
MMDPENIPINQLRAILKKAGLLATGSKVEMIARYKIGLNSGVIDPKAKIEKKKADKPKKKSIEPIINEKQIETIFRNKRKAIIHEAYILEEQELIYSDDIQSDSPIPLESDSEEQESIYQYK